MECTAHSLQLSGVHRRRPLPAQEIGSVKSPSLGRCSAEVNLMCLEASSRGVEDHTVIDVSAFVQYGTQREAHGYP
jgi:hypothetical protein